MFVLSSISLNQKGIIDFSLSYFNSLWHTTIIPSITSSDLFECLGLTLKYVILSKSLTVHIFSINLTSISSSCLFFTNSYKFSMEFNNSDIDIVQWMLTIHDGVFLGIPNDFFNTLNQSFTISFSLFCGFFDSIIIGVHWD